MPLPSPRKDENQSSFVSRCMGDSKTKSEFPDQKQRNAVCFSRFRKGKASELTDQEVDAMSRIMGIRDYPEADDKGKKKKKKKKKKMTNKDKGHSTDDC